jgi:hypothetical protein
MVAACAATECVHSPAAASAPHTAAMKSAVMPSSSVEFHVVAGVSAVQSGGSSSATTTYLHDKQVGEG